MKAFVRILLSLLGILPAFSLYAQTTSGGMQEPVYPKETKAESLPVKVLTGTVFNDMGEPLAGANVSVVGDKNNTITTNSVGGYVLRTTTAKPVLRITYAGYKDMEQTVSATQPTSFTLEAVANYKRDLKKRSKAAEKAYKN
ncbi:carboxypeptidase-like regulatory domain-containing protein [Hymenobacter wooponensis]|uniref:Carboxypeptidase-like regulatory domain-containing protein n=1 Tax=Hymenobacter wooponensis TaxID=1525360 RepID=A0A4Z0MSD9_9BACT|nr:carboxypeptidase-like regulatory domain-containing protein [Hymenobacter wooponensis]TGD82258.1 hypothetical protein EU557_00255 [Hymenobacter wooponensis]